MKLYKYQGAGNDFLLIDNRDGRISHSDSIISDGETSFRIDEICDRRYGIGADGLMLLENVEDADFRMVYYNSDGSGGMMCGNGGRCIVAFAADLGVFQRTCNFVAADGSHTARILSEEGKVKTVCLQMKDVSEIRQTAHGIFMDTGTRHLVVPVDDIASYNVVTKGRELRYHPDYQPIGVNVNFTEFKDGVLHVRTYEKGVEDETYACGTGITASAIATCHPIPVGSGAVHIAIQALRDRLAVDFTPTENGAAEVWLTGPATRVAELIL